MVMTPREKKIAQITAVAVGLFVAYEFVISPFMTALGDTNQRLKESKDQIESNDLLFRMEQKKKKIWTDMLAGGLKDNHNEAEDQAQRGINYLGEDMHVTIESFKNDRTTQENKFEVINFHVGGKAKMADTAAMIYYMEMAKFPLRINQIQVIPRTEGANDLQVTFNISTLCNNPPVATATNSSKGQP